MRRRARRTLLEWVVSVLATVASTYALDASATAAGLALAATPLLDGLGTGWLIMLLVASYPVWFYGLGCNLRANGALLERTGTSTSVLSKACHSVAVRRSAGPRARRLAAAAGYIVVEIAKEVPYYAGAFGASTLSDTVTNADALVFLIGANFGAAAYERVLAAVTTSVLDRRFGRLDAGEPGGADYSPRRARRRARASSRMAAPSSSVRRSFT